jgi:hypothetical protein
LVARRSENGNQGHAGAERLDIEFGGFSGGASRFDDIDLMESMRDESVVLGTGLSVDALGPIVRRQLVGSILVGCGIAAAAILVALRPIGVEAPDGPAAHNFPVIQHPTFAAPAGHSIAALKTGAIGAP